MLAWASASEYTATVFTPMRLAVAATRQAISTIRNQDFCKHSGHLAEAENRKKHAAARRAETLNKITSSRRHGQRQYQRNAEGQRVLVWPARPWTTTRPSSRKRAGPSWKNGSARCSRARAVILVARPWPTACRPTTPPPRPCWRCRVPNTPAANSAPAGIADEGMHRVPGAVQPRHLVGKEFDQQHEAAGHQHHRCCSTVSAGGGDPVQRAHAADQKHHRIQAHAAGSSPGLARASRPGMSSLPRVARAAPRPPPGSA